MMFIAFLSLPRIRINLVISDSFNSCTVDVCILQQIYSIFACLNNGTRDQAERREFLFLACSREVQKMESVCFI